MNHILALSSCSLHETGQSHPENLTSIISNSSYMLGVCLCVLANLYSYAAFSMFSFTVALN